MNQSSAFFTFLPSNTPEKLKKSATFDNRLLEIIAVRLYLLLFSFDNYCQYLASGLFP